MKVSVKNQKGEAVKETLLPKEIFGVEKSRDLLHQVVVSQMANRRRNIAHTKTRSEVSGGGRKPWRQKGLGRARHGSRRSPIWVKGGITFGPRNERIFKKDIPRKMRKAALLTALSLKAKSNELVVLDELKLKEPKTKLLGEVLKGVLPGKASALIVLPGMDGNVILAAKNISKVSTIQARDLNCLDIASFKYLVMPLESIKVIKETFAGKNDKKQKTGSK